MKSKKNPETESLMVFSGIVECRGEVLSVSPLNGSSRSDGITLALKPQKDAFMNADISIGCSIAVKGVCLTVTKFAQEV